jgi:hypothetical protein
VIVIAFPNVPELAERLVIDGGATTLKLTLLVVTVPAVTVTPVLPVTTPDGTVRPTAVGVQELKLVTGIVPNFAVPWVEPKPLPLTVTELPTAPEVGDKLVMATTVKATPLLAVPTVTTTFPDVAPVGTFALTLVLVQLPDTIVAVTPLNLTVLVPCDVPKPLPVIVTVVPMVPDVGDRLVIDGVANASGETAKISPTMASLMLFIIPPAEREILFNILEFTVDT